MSLGWINSLYETYENCRSEIGNGINIETTLLPIAHSTQNAQIEIAINGTGEFLRARILDKQEQMTIIPVTEDSGTRSGTKPPPHPLCDKLQYVAGDYCNYVKNKNAAVFYMEYIKLIRKWCQSEFSNKKVQAVFCYVSKGDVIKDLINSKVLVCDGTGMLDSKIKINGISQADAFVRFRVEIPGDVEPCIWLDKEVYDSYISFYLNIKEGQSLCYVTGRVIPCSDKHPSKVRNTGDKAKLISANDERGFTYKGRFANRDQVVQVGYEISQKAHNVLRWLINKQGYKNGESVIVAWGTQNESIPHMLEDTQDSLFGTNREAFVDTQSEFADRLNKAIAGYGHDIDIKSHIIIMAVEAATTGRLSITYYREMDGGEFLDRIKQWHSTCIWKHNYKKASDGLDEKGKKNFKSIYFIGAPSPADIAIAAYGDRIKDKRGKELKKLTVERILTCIIDQSKLPYDIVNSAVNRVSNPITMEKWEWQKALTVTCALIRKYRYDRFKEEWNMSLDENQRDRSYLFGRLLAIAQQIEEWSISTSGEKRDTNAERLMHQFKLHPYRTWGTISNKLRPYISRLGSRSKSLVELMTRVNSLISYEEFTSNQQLDDSYLLGYYCQRQAFIDERDRMVEQKNKEKLMGKMEERIK